MSTIGDQVVAELPKYGLPIFNTIKGDISSAITKLSNLFKQEGGLRNLATKLCKSENVNELTLEQLREKAGTLFKKLKIDLLSISHPTDKFYIGLGLQGDFNETARVEAFSEVIQGILNSSHQGELKEPQLIKEYASIAENVFKLKNKN